jgi:hypothetical protein
MDTPEARYRRDPLFKQLVDTIYVAIVECKYTPTEVREAAVLASIIYERRHCASVFPMTPKEVAE